MRRARAILRAVLVLVALLAAFPSCRKSSRDYGMLKCLDGWPGQPSDGPRDPIAAMPAILWQKNLGFPSPPFVPGVAVSGDQVIVTGGPSWVALSRATGEVQFGNTTTPANYDLSSPITDSQGGIYFQSNASLHAYSADGTLRWSKDVSPVTSAEPEPASFTPTLIDNRVIAMRSPGPSVAIDTDGTQLWRSGGPLVPAYAVGHWGLGYDGTASFVVDLRKPSPAGRLRDGTGHDVIFLAALGGRGIIVGARDSAGLRLALLDTCGSEVWSLGVEGQGLVLDSGRALVGPGEITYVQIYRLDSSGNQLKASDLIAIDPTGRMIAGPVSREETPWLVGADGTVYAAEYRSLRLSSRVVALSPMLEEKWSIEVDGGIPTYSSAALTDDGALYFQNTARAGNQVFAIQTTSPGLARSSWPALRHDNASTNWGGGQW